MSPTGGRGGGRRNSNPKEDPGSPAPFKRSNSSRHLLIDMPDSGGIRKTLGSLSQPGSSSESNSPRHGHQQLSRTYSRSRSQSPSLGRGGSRGGRNGPKHSPKTMHHSPEASHRPNAGQEHHHPVPESPKSSGLFGSLFKELREASLHDSLPPPRRPPHQDHGHAPEQHHDHLPPPRRPPHQDHGHAPEHQHYAHVVVPDPHHEHLPPPRRPPHQDHGLAPEHQHHTPEQHHDHTPDQRHSSVPDHRRNSLLHHGAIPDQKDSPVPHHGPSSLPEASHGSVPDQVRSSVPHHGSPDRRHSSVPDHGRSSVPHHATSSIPVGRRSPVQDHDRSSVPHHGTSSSPERRHSSIPDHGRSSVPYHGTSSIPDGRRSPVQDHDRSSVPHHGTSPDRRHSSIIDHRGSSVPGQERSSILDHRHSSIPDQVRSSGPDRPQIRQVGSASQPSSSLQDHRPSPGFVPGLNQSTSILHHSPVDHGLGPEPDHSPGALQSHPRPTLSSLAQSRPTSLAPSNTVQYSVDPGPSSAPDNVRTPVPNKRLSPLQDAKTGTNDPQHSRPAGVTNPKTPRHSSGGRGNQTTAAPRKSGSVHHAETHFAGDTDRNKRNHGPLPPIEENIEDYDPSADIQSDPAGISAFEELEKERQAAEDIAAQQELEEGINKVEDMKAKRSIQELFVYLLFLITGCTIVFSMTSRSAFYASNAMAKTFMDTPFFNMNNVANKTIPDIVAPSPKPPPALLANREEPPPNPFGTTNSPEKQTTTASPTQSESEVTEPEPTDFHREMDKLDADLTKDNADRLNYGLPFPQKTRRSTRQKRASGTDEKNPEGGAAGGTSTIMSHNHLRSAKFVQDFWDFMQTTFVNFLFWEHWYSDYDPVAHTVEDDKLVLYSSKLLGFPRIRQLRVRPDSCVIHPQVSHLFKTCFGYYSSWAEDQGEMKATGPTTDTAEAWAFQTAEKLQSMPYYGVFSIYGGGGFALDLSVNKAVTVAKIDELKKNLWIDRATRAVIIDYTIYNSNVNLFIVCKIVVEFPPTGGIIPYGNFQTLKFLRYVTVQDHVVLGFELSFIVFLGYYTVMFVKMSVRLKRKIFRSFWNYIDFLIVAFGIIIGIMSIYRFFAVEAMVLEKMHSEGEHPALDFPRIFQDAFDNLWAVLLFLMWVKLFKYLNFSQTINELNRTLARSAGGILAFTVMFGIIFVAFAQLAYLVFGAEVEQYQSVWSAIVSLLQAILGTFNYKEIEEAHFILGPIFLILFIFFIFFVLMNMFGAIIIESYKTVRAQIFPPNEKIVSTYLARGARNIICCGRKRKKKIDQSEVAISYKSIKDALYRAGFSQIEIDVFFAKYEIKVDRDISGHEAQKLVERLELRRFDFDPVDTSAQTVAEMQKEFERMKKTVEGMEKQIDIHTQQLKWREEEDE